MAERSSVVSFADFAYVAGWNELIAIFLQLQRPYSALYQTHNDIIS